MKKKAFTLTEMLGVIVILGLIALVIFPNVTKSIKSSRKKLYDQQVELIEDNARRWGVEHANLLPEDGAYYLELEELVKGGYITHKELKDPRNESTMDGCIVIGFKSEYNQYKYEYVTTPCKENQKPNRLLTVVEQVNASSETRTDDPRGNVRYVGKNPSNYVKFNDELWRIVGIFNGQAKIVRSSSYKTSIAWNSTNENDWSTSTLQAELNGSYLNSITEISQAYIDKTHIWNIGGSVKTNTEYTRVNMYNSERGTVTPTGRPATWAGAIGLIYVSDYGYSTSSTESYCALSMYNWEQAGNESCKNNSWLSDSSIHQWLLNPANGDLVSVFVTTPSGRVGYLPASQSHGVKPTLFLKSTVKIKGGTGTSSDPFLLTQ